MPEGHKIILKISVLTQTFFGYRVTESSMRYGEADPVKAVDDMYPKLHTKFATVRDHLCPRHVGWLNWSGVGTIPRIAGAPALTREGLPRPSICQTDILAGGSSSSRE